MYRVVPSYFQCWKVRKSLLLMEWRILRFQLYGQTTKRRDVPSPSSSLPTHFSSTAILRVPSRGVIATRVEPPPASSPIPCPTIFQYETKRKEIETFLASPERKSYLLSVDILYTYIFRTWKNLLVSVQGFINVLLSLRFRPITRRV